jgi:hypothetical protein
MRIDPFDGVRPRSGSTLSKGVEGLAPRTLLSGLSLLPHRKMLPERMVGEGAFGKGFKDSIKFILHGLS